MWHKDGSGQRFEEHYFKGCLHNQLRSALSFIQTQRRIVAREYRNRRIGDFLKELQLTEGRATGFPAIYDAMEANGSPKPIFETDDESTYFLTIIPAHPLADRTFIVPEKQTGVYSFNHIDDIVSFLNETTDNHEGIKENDQVSDQVSDQVGDQVSDQVKAIIKKEVSPFAENILRFVEKGEVNRVSILANCGLSNHTDNKKRHIDPLLHLGWVNFTNPDNPRAHNQKYKITPPGKQVLLLLDNKN